MPENARVIRIVEGTPRIVADDWRLIDSAAAWDAVERDAEPGEAKHRDAAQRDAAPGEGLIVALELALAQPARLRALGRAGVWLAPTDDPARAAEFFDRISLIGVNFPKFTDGRGYSTAVLLRTRLAWRGELRALGDVLQDQLYALRRVGFDSFALRADRDAAAALRAFSTFSGSYQGSVEPALPAFRQAEAAS